VWPTPKVPNGTIELRGLYKNNTSLLIADAGVSLCGPVPSGRWPDDPGCKSPVATGTTDVSGDTTLDASLMLPSVLNGDGWIPFLRIDADGYPPNFYYGPAPLSEATAVYGPPFTRPLPMDPQVPTTPTGGSTPGIGTVWFVAFDCLFSPAGGVVIRDESGDAAFNPGSEAGTGGAGSQAPGVAVQYGFPAGPHTFTATPISLGKPSSTVQAYVEDGGVTWVLLPPTP
jgi:hypothetical protein